MSRDEIEQAVSRAMTEQERPGFDQMDMGPTVPTSYEDVPHDTLRGITNHVLRGIPTGGFLKAVLSNDLFRAVGLADLANQKALSNIIEFLYNFCPSDSYGGAAKVEDWISMKGTEGRGIVWDFQHGEPAV